MFIDFHTHIFPDKVAARSIPMLAKLNGEGPYMDGTYDDLLRCMDKSGVDISVVLPVVTAPRQFDSILRFADGVNEKFYDHPDHGILSLAGIHPECDDLEGKLKVIKEHGFAGIKLHPDYQGILFNDIRIKRIIYKASELDMTVITHTGLDPYSPDLVHCTAEMILEVIEEVAPPKLVLAHMGQCEMYDVAEKYLLGAPAYLDTAFTISHTTPERLLSMIRKHGADRVLFATDTPWSDPVKDVPTIENLGLTDQEFDQVTHLNARKLLHL